MNVHCAKCGRSWMVPLKLPMPIDRAVQAMRGFVKAGCPGCGAHGKNVLCGRAPKKSETAKASA